MLKSALVEYVRTRVLGTEPVADNQKTVHYKRIEQGVNYAFDSLVAGLSGTRSGDAEIESYYVKSYYNQPVLQSDSYRYVAVSDDVIPVGSGRGIWYVQPSKTGLKQKDAGVNFARFKRPEAALYGSLPVGEVINETFWRFGNVTTNRQIVLEDIGDSQHSDIRRVDYGVVRAFSSYEDTEEVYMPQGRTDLIVQIVMTQFGQVYNDLTNNGQ